MAGFSGMAARLLPRRNAADTSLSSGPRMLAPQPTQLGQIREGQQTGTPGPGRLLIDPGPSIEKPAAPLDPKARRKGRLAAAGNLLLDPSGMGAAS